MINIAYESFSYMFFYSISQIMKKRESCQSVNNLRIEKYFNQTHLSLAVNSPTYISWTIVMQETAYEKNACLTNIKFV